MGLGVHAYTQELTQELEAGGLQVQGWAGLHSKYKVGLGNLVRSCLNIKSALRVLQLSSEHLLSTQES